MKVICAWCGSPMQITCHCGSPLTPTSYVGSTFEPNAMVCFNGLTPMIYSQRVIDEMPVSHGLCKSCAQMPANERESLLIERRKADKSIPENPVLAEIAAETLAAQNHERSTRRPARSAPPPQQLQIQEQTPRKKRGPTAARAGTQLTGTKPHKKGDTA